MALWVMADTHLSLGVDKPMDVFGSRWTDHAAKIKKNWEALVSENDTVVIPGDLSWGLNLKEALPDLLFLDALPGKKIFLKGNHDYYWDTVTKMTAFNAENKITTFTFLHNNAVRCEDFILCGARGWYTEGKKVITATDVDTDKIVAREVGRLRTSLNEGKRLHDEILANEGKDLEILAFLHFPPFFTGYICDEIIAELYRGGVERCYFGHIHGTYDVPPVRNYMDIDFHFIAADFLDFVPKRIWPKENIANG